VTRLWWYLRSRSVPATLATIAGCAAALLVIGAAVDDPIRIEHLPLVMTALAASSVAPGLAGADPDLERTSALDWRWRRAVHMMVAVAVVAALLAAAAPAGTPTWRMVRDTVGLTGLVGIGVTALGTGLAAALPVLTVALALFVGAADQPAYRVLATWMVLPVDRASAWAVAVAFGLAGVAAYSLAGPRS
jgi:hypothetical protein